MRERATTSPVVQTVRRRDIWDFLQSILGLSIQRLVSTNLLKPTVARLLLSEFLSRALSSSIADRNFSHLNRHAHPPSHAQADACGLAGDAARLDRGGGGVARAAPSGLEGGAVQDYLGCFV